MYVRFPCQVFPISDCDVGRATGAASISWVPKYELTCSQFRIMVTVVGALGAAPGMREVLRDGLPLGPVQALPWPAAGSSSVSYYHPPRHLFTHHQKMGVVLRAFLLDEAITPVCKQPIHLRDNGRLSDDNFPGDRKGQQPCRH